MKHAFILLLFVAGTLNSPAQDLKAIDRYIEQARKDWNVPGLSVAVVKDGKIILAKGYGVRELGKAEVVNEHTQFAIASNTKAFVAAALSRLVIEKKISWKDKVRDHLPYFALYGDYETANTTIEDLLCHRVGLGTFSGDVIWYKTEKSAEEMLMHLRYVPKAFEFRDGYGYSNLMFIAAGEVIRKVTGKNWEEYVRESFFTPLDMKNTVTSISVLNSNAATPHKPTLNNGTIPIAWANWDTMGAAGGIISSAHDMAQWMMVNLESGNWKGQSLIDKSQLNLLWTIHNNFVLSDFARELVPGRHMAGYGLGWSITDYHGTLAVSHGGGYDGMYSRVMMIPDIKLGIVVLTNSMEGIATPLTYYIANQYLKKDLRDWSKEFLERARKDEGHKKEVEERTSKRVLNTQPSKKISDCTGIYFDPMYGNISVMEREGKLRIEFERAPKLGATLSHWHYDTYLIEWDEEHAWYDFGTVAFVMDNNQAVTGLSFDVPNGDIFFHELKPVRKK
jgi:CubicO group peptidase (beta-lactamase class C family)